MNLFKETATADIDLDDPASYGVIREIIQRKPFLNKLYSEWYLSIAATLQHAPPGPVLEVGSGAGFLKNYVPGLITSEIQLIPWVDLVVDARALPFGHNALSGIAMVDVLHHIPDVTSFLTECDRCVKPGGVIVMIEPWITKWSKLVYTYLHHEPIDAAAEQWTLPPGRPMSMANSALPWIVFERDKHIFKERCRQLQITEIELLMPTTYLLSGGISYKSIVPGPLYKPWRVFERFLTSPINKYTAMFAKITLTKNDEAIA